MPSLVPVMIFVILVINNTSLLRKKVAPAVAYSFFKFLALLVFLVRLVRLFFAKNEPDF